MGGSESLPGRFPIFPLRGALLLPGGNLPLNIFEPRYLAMVRDAMQTDRIIGMIQPKNRAGEMGTVEVYRVGCAGRITNFEETPDGRYLVTLTGLSRFDVKREIETDTPYRQVEPAYERWRGDARPAMPSDCMKPELVETLKAYFDQQGVEVDWESIQGAPLAGLITSLAMICPFEPNEKQALLEAQTLERQGRMLIALMQMSINETETPSTRRH